MTFRAVIANDFSHSNEGDLVPGQYVPVRMVLGERQDALLVPKPALIETQAGQQVYVVDKDNKVVSRTVEVGQAYKDQWVIEERRRARRAGDRRGPAEGARRARWSTPSRRSRRQARPRALEDAMTGTEMAARSTFRALGLTLGLPMTAALSLLGCNTVDSAAEATMAEQRLARPAAIVVQEFAISPDAPEPSAGRRQRSPATTPSRRPSNSANSWQRIW